MSSVTGHSAPVYRKQQAECKNQQQSDVRHERGVVEVAGPQQEDEAADAGQKRRIQQQHSGGLQVSPGYAAVSGQQWHVHSHFSLS